jgi:riboflavin kinase / FMN adenylyltransferase
VTTRVVVPARSGRRGSVVAVGTFDGVHRGHQAILRRAARLARRHRLQSVALTFARPPRLFFSPQPGPQLLTLPSEKARILKDLGMDRVEILRFDQRLARLSAADFFQRFLIRRFRARHIVVGYNFLFGRGREGDTAFLREAGKKIGVRVHVVAPVGLQGAPVSSGQIRRHLAEGDLVLARRKLARPYEATGRVKTGQGLGRRLGFPTANVELPPEKIVPPGVFAVRVTLPDGRQRPGLCNVGVRPTLREKRPRRTVEVHILDFSGDLRGKVVRVEFLIKLREEKKFGSLAALARQLQKDAARARRRLRPLKP